MKKLPFTAFLLGSILIAALSLNSISFLSRLSEMPNELNLDALIRGQLIQLLFVNEYWALFPTLPTLQFTLLLSPGALIVMGLLLGAIYYFMAYRRKYNPLIVSAALLAAVMIPYGLGWMALANNNGQPGKAGPWLAFMLVGMFYAAAACALFSVRQLVKNR